MYSAPRLVINVINLNLMKTRMFYGNQFIGSFDLNKKPFIKRVSKIIKSVIWNSAKLCVVVWLMVGSAATYNHLKPIKVYAQQVVTVKDTTLSPVMQRIEKCESSASQTGRDGQTTIHVNSDGSYDTGIFQINSTWNKTATKMGLDLNKQADNEAFAEYLYENVGTQPWYSSAKCWQK